MNNAPVISTGEPSTLKTYRAIAAALTGEQSDAVKFFDEKIKDQGPDERVIATESQVIYLIMSMAVNEGKKQNG